MNTIEYIDEKVALYMPLIEAYPADTEQIRSILIQAISNAVSDTIIEIANESYSQIDENGNFKLRIVK